MEKRPDRILRGVGFYAALVLCLTAVGAAAWFLLFRSDVPAVEPADAPAVISEEPKVKMPEVETPVSTAHSAQTIPVPEKEESVAAAAPAAVAVDPTPVAAEAPGLIVSPLNGEVVAAFSVEQLTYSETLDDWRTHDGIDVAAAAGTPVLAASAGTVLSVSDDALMGTCVTLRHAGGYETTYASLQTKPTVSAGDSVTAGQIIGAVGTTSLAEQAEGPHLHFSVTKDGEAVSPDSFLDS